MVEWADEWERVMADGGQDSEPEPGPQPCKLCGKVGPPNLVIRVEYEEREPVNRDAM